MAPRDHIGTISMNLAAIAPKTRIFDGHMSRMLYYYGSVTLPEPRARAIRVPPQDPP